MNFVRMKGFLNVRKTKNIRYFNSAKVLLTLSNFIQSLNELASTASITIYELLKIVCLSVSIFFSNNYIYSIPFSEMINRIKGVYITCDFSIYLDSSLNLTRSTIVRITIFLMEIPVFIKDIN